MDAESVAGYSPRRGGKPGLAPAGDSLFFASPKKSKQKKGDPAVCDPAAVRRGNLRQTAIAGGPRKLATLKHARTCPGHRRVPQAHTEGRGTQIQQVRAMARTCGVGVFSSPSVCACDWPKTSYDEGRLFERSEFAAFCFGSIAGCPSVAKRSAGSQTVGSPFLGYFLWRPKESNSPAGANSRQECVRRRAHIPAKADPAGTTSQPGSLTC